MKKNTTLSKREKTLWRLKIFTLIKDNIYGYERIILPRAFLKGTGKAFTLPIYGKS
jgi:hypothetical protein